MSQRRDRGGVVLTIRDEDGVQRRIDRALPGMSAAQRKVAVFIAENHTRVGYLSAATIGRRVGVSDATVVRTAQELGYEGLSGLKGAIATELADPSLSERLRNVLDVETDPTHEMMALHVEGLERLVAPNMIAETRRAVAALTDAERVFLAGTGPSAPIAAYGAELLARIGVDARALVRSGVAAADDIVGLAAGDVVVLLAYSRVAPHVEALLHHAERLDLVVVLLTDHLAPPPGPSVVLRTGRGSTTGSASHVTTVAMLEALALMAAEQDPDRSTSTLDEVNRLRDRIARRTGADRGDRER